MHSYHDSVALKAKACKSDKVMSFVFFKNVLLWDL